MDPDPAAPPPAEPAPSASPVAVTTDARALKWAGAATPGARSLSMKSGGDHPARNARSHPLPRDMACVGFPSCAGGSGLWETCPGRRQRIKDELGGRWPPACSPLAQPLIQCGCLSKYFLANRPCFLQNSPDAVYAPSPESQSTVLSKVI